MRIIGGLLFALLVASLPLAAQNPAAQPSSETAQDKQNEQDAPAARLTFDGEAALLTVAIRPDKTADFESVLSKLQAVLKQSEDPQRRKQAEGWKVMRLSTALPDGNIAYVHVIHPVVPGAGYGIMQILYDALPEERKELYDLYRGAFVRNVALAVGSVAMDVNAVGAPAASPSTPASPPAPSPPVQPSPQPSVPPDSPR
jgi:hypothetical protein